MSNENSCRSHCVPQPPPETEFEVELWSTAPEAVASVRGTLSMLKPGEHELIEREGRYFIKSTHVGFTKFAVERQGYVKRVLS